MTKYKIERIYKSTAPDDSYRVLVDRLWPRGISKERAALNEWNKEIAPTDELRKWFNHDPEKFPEFSRRYMKELDNNPAAAEAKNNWNKQSAVTLLYGAKDAEHNQAIVLKKWLEDWSIARRTLA